MLAIATPTRMLADIGQVRWVDSEVAGHVRQAASSTGREAGWWVHRE